MGEKLAIDFGTTNSVIARWDSVRVGAEVIAPAGIHTFVPGERQIVVPSLLYVEEGRAPRVIIGQHVLERGLDRENADRLFRNFKRGIVSASTALAREIDGVAWTDQDAARTFLRHLIDQLPYTTEEIEQLVLTVPVAAFERYLTWLTEAVSERLHDRLRIVDESTAAALGYAVTQPGAVVMVFDFGGGSLDVSLVQLPESREQTGGFLQQLRRVDAQPHRARVIAKGGRIIGGSDIDRWLLAEVLKRAGLTSAASEKDRAHWLTVCEQTKIALSTQGNAHVTFEADGRVYDVALGRIELEALLEANGFFVAVQEVVDKLLHVAQREGVFKEDIHTVLMVGGGSLMPALQRLLKQYFGEAIVRIEKPFTAVAEGALQVAVGLGLEDYLAHGYGLRCLDQHANTHVYEEIIPMGIRYPSAQPVEVLLAAAHEDQDAIEFVIGEIDSASFSSVEVRYEEGQAVFVAQADSAAQHVVPLNEQVAAQSALALQPPGRRGIERVQAQFMVDDRRQLKMTAIDLKTQRELVRDAIVARLDPRDTRDTALPAAVNRREPLLPARATLRGRWRLSLRGIATLLNLLPPESISLEATEAALRSTDFFVRYHASRVLMQRGDRAARIILQSVLSDGAAPARASAARQLHGFSWFASEPLLRQALADPDVRVREAATYALCDMRDANAYRLLAEVLAHASDSVRAAAAWGLRECRDVAAVPALEAVLLALDPEVRIKGLEALGVNASSAAIPIVRRMLDDPELDVQYAATLSLLECGREASLAELADAIVRNAGSKRIPLLRGMFHATNYLGIDLAQSATVDHVIDALEQALRDDRPKVRMAAVWPLAWMRHPRAAQALKHAYNVEQDDIVKTHMVTTSVNLMSDAGAELLADARATSTLPLADLGVIPARASIPRRARGPRIELALFCAALLLLVLWVYAPALSLPLFQDDVDHFNWIGGNDIATLWSTSPFGYYRPLTQTLWKLSQLLAGRFDPPLLHWINLLLHAFNAALVGWLAEACLPESLKRRGRWLAAALFALFPFSFQAVPFVGALFHPLVSTLILGTLLGHHVYRSSDNRIGLGIAFTCALLAPFAHETGLLAGVFLSGAELLSAHTQQRRSAWPIVFGGLVVSVAGFAIWLIVPKTGPQTGRPDLNGILINLSYAVQGLAYPFGPIQRAFVDAGVSDQIVLWISGALLIALIVWIARRAGYLRLLGIGLALWIVSALPYALTLVPAYVLAAPRLLYVTSIGVTGVWTITLLGLGQWVGRTQMLRRALTVLATIVVLSFSFVFVRSRMPYYTLLGDALWQLGAALESDSSALVVNMPRAARPSDRVFAIGTEWPLFFGRSDGLREGLLMNGIDTPDDVHVITFGNLIPALPYQIETMGAAADWPDLSAAIGLGARVYRSYPASDAIAMRYAGQTLARTTQLPLIEYGDAVELIDVELDVLDDRMLAVTLRWQYNGGADDAQVFVHMLNAQGELVAQSDGVVMDMLPFWQWPAGAQVEEVRYIQSNDTTGALRVNVGLFNSAGRLAPIDFRGQSYADGSVPLFEVNVTNGAVRDVIRK